MMSILPVQAVMERPVGRAGGESASATSSDAERVVVRLFDQSRTPLFRYVLSFGMSIQDSEEIIQEVSMALFRHLQLGKSRRNLRGWVFSVAHNLALKWRQKNQRRPDGINAKDSAAAGRLDTAPNPEELLILTQRQRRLLAVIEALPERDQCCLRLRAEGLRYREIARALGISLGAVSASLARSIERLSCVDGN